MIEGHLMRVVLEPVGRYSLWFEVHEAFHGITAPGFLFTAGFAFAIATLRRWDQARSLSPAFFRRLWRGVMFILLGYALHVPYFSLSKTLNHASESEWLTFLAFGILQLIGVCLVTARILLVTIRSEKVFLAVVVLLFLSIVFLTPLMWSSDLTDSLPRILSLAVSGRGVSFSPVFPFAAFMLAGIFVSWQFLRATEKGHEDRFMWRLGVAGIILTAAGFLTDWLPLRVFTPYDFWFTSPSYFWIRLGIILMLMGAFWSFERLVKHGDVHDVWMPTWLTNLGTQSFFAYIIHLIVVFGWVGNPFHNIEAFWTSALGVGEALLLYCAVVAFVVVASLVWRYLKKEHAVLIQASYWWLAGMFVYYFLTNPF
jgi:hypothetical protein